MAISNSYVTNYQRVPFPKNLQRSHTWIQLRSVRFYFLDELMDPPLVNLAWGNHPAADKKLLKDLEFPGVSRRFSAKSRCSMIFL
jgi:hypothetical protein